jgi:solute carrier family 35 protein E1
MLQEESMDDINLFSLITVLSFLLSCPLMLLAEGVKFSPAYLQSTVSHCQQNSDNPNTPHCCVNSCSK